MRRLSLLILLVLSVSACGAVALHHNLGESEADKILVLLDKNGITADKEMALEGQEVTWTVTVPKANVSEARRLLVENNMPHRPELGLSGVYSEKGLIPTPDEQRARFILALKGELVNALRKIPGVHEVGVVLNVPETKDLMMAGEVAPRPSASVVLRIADPAMLRSELTEDKIKQFVANAIPEMQAADVVVILNTVEGGRSIYSSGGDVSTAKGFPPPPRSPPPGGGPNGGIAVSPGTDEVAEETVEIAGIELNADSLGKFRVYLIVFLLVLILLSAALLLTLFRFSRMRRRSKSRRLEAVPIEGQAGGPNLLTSGHEAMGGGRGPSDTGTGGP